jgi:hypothetical protein
MAAVRELVQSGIPGFALAAKGRRRKITTTASLPDAFLEAGAAACGVHPDLTASAGMSAAAIRESIAYSRVYASVAEELRILARGVDDTVAEDRNRVGQGVLTMYYVAERINRPEDRELLIPHLAAMKRTINRGRKRTTKPPETPAKPPTTTTPPTTPPVVTPKTS